MLLHFVINGAKVVLDEHDEELIQKLLNDDNFTVEFFIEAIKQDKLAKFGIFSNTVGEKLEIIREIVAPVNTNVIISQNQSSGDNVASTSSEKKLWIRESTQMLINLYEENEVQFERGIKKHVWQKVATEINEKFHTNVTWIQCDTKWKTLIKTYKEIKQHNSTSGNQTRQWEYFHRMDKILFKKPEISPVATCSSNMGLLISGNTANATALESSSNGGNVNVQPDEQNTESSFARRRRRVNPIERRHQERMQRQDRFLEILERIATSLERQNNAN